MKQRDNRVSNRNFERGFDYFFAQTEGAPTNEVTLLADCRRVFERMLSRVMTARQRVWLQMYVFDDDALGRCFERGVDVRVLCDGYGCRRSRLTLMRRLRREGVRVAVDGFRWGEWPDCRNHRKMLVADDVAVVGGVNIAVRYLRSWRDVCVEIGDGSVERFARLFLTDWHRACGEVLEPATECDKSASVGCVARNTEEVFVRLVERTRRRVLLSTPYLVPTRRVRGRWWRVCKGAWRLWC